MHLLALIPLLITLTSAATTTNSSVPLDRLRDFQLVRANCIKDLNANATLPGVRPESLCLDRCILTRQDIMGDDGAIDVDSIPTPLQELATRCERESAHMEICPRARYFIRCLIRSLVIKLRNVSRHCSLKHNVSFGSIGGLRKNIEDIISGSAGDHPCYERCFIIGLGVMDEQDNFVVGNMQISPELGVTLQELMSVCTEENQQVDVCQKVVARNVCLNGKIRERKRKV